MVSMVANNFAEYKNNDTVLFAVFFTFGGNASMRSIKHWLHHTNYWFCQKAAWNEHQKDCRNNPQDGNAYGH